MNEEEKKAAADKEAADKAAADAKAKADAEAGDKKPKSDADKTYEELKAEAEAAEVAYKNAKGGISEDELKANMIRRRDKANERLTKIKNGDVDDDDKPNNSRKPEIAVEDLVTLEVKGIDKNSEQAKILKRYVDAGIVKTYKEGLTHVAVKAELDALNADKDAKTVIDENDTPENQLKTKKEVIAGYKASGEVPKDPKLVKAIAEENLKDMSL